MTTSPSRALQLEVQTKEMASAFSPDGSRLLATTTARVISGMWKPELAFTRSPGTTHPLRLSPGAPINAGSFWATTIEAFEFGMLARCWALEQAAAIRRLFAWPSSGSTGRKTIRAGSGV